MGRRQRLGRHILPANPRVGDEAGGGATLGRLLAEKLLDETNGLGGDAFPLLTT